MSVFDGALSFATFHGSCTDDGGAVDSTGLTTASHCAFILTMNAEGKMASMVKVWKAPRALGNPGWA